MILRFIVLLTLGSALFAQTDEAALGRLGVSVAAGYRFADASAFRDRAHPEVVKKIRRLMIERLGHQFSFAPPAVTNAESASKLTDAEVVDAFVKFVTSVNQFAAHMSAEWSHQVSRLVIDGTRAKVSVTERLEAQNRNDGTRISSTSERLVEFELHDGNWMYIAGPGTLIHLDLPLGIR